MSLAIVKAARRFLALGKQNDVHLSHIEKNEQEKETILKSWGDALTATIAEIKEKQDQAKSEAS